MIESSSSGESVDRLTVDGYLDNDQHNLDQIRRSLPHFRQLIPRIHALYEVSRSLIPPDSDRLFGRCLLLCHKAFLSAAAAIGRRHPDDAGPITRRAIEVIKLAVAYTLDGKNLERWQQSEERLKRWSDRHEGEIPRPIHVQYSERVREYPGLKALRRFEGILSDAFVHFTPEFVVLQAFRDTIKGDTTSIELPFIESDQKVIEQQLLHLAEIHNRIIDIFDECYDGAFSRETAWQAATREAARWGSALAEHYMKTRVISREDIK